MNLVFLPMSRKDLQIYIFYLTLVYLWQMRTSIGIMIQPAFKWQYISRNAINLILLSFAVADFAIVLKKSWHNIFHQILSLNTNYAHHMSWRCTCDVTCTVAAKHAATDECRRVTDVREICAAYDVHVHVHRDANLRIK